ncbi:MAG TPA: hypothetical protein VK348_00445 [Planctomycetota bacterium]|nr:hypothetical protein [Planctomycetota bacterium]
MNLVTLGLPLLAAVGILTFGNPAPRSDSSAPATIDLAAPQGGGPVFSLRSLQGHHGFSYSGTILGVGPIASSGPIFFDGQGGLSASYSTVVNGITFHGSFVGTYAVHADGSGAVTLVLPLLGLQSHGDFVLVDEGKGTFFNSTDAGFSISGATRKM